MEIKVKKLTPEAVLPSYGSVDAAGLDLTAVSEKFYFNAAVNYVEYGTGIAVEIPKGYVGLIFPRSSITSKTSLILGNSVGVIDSDYRGEIKFRFKSILASGGKKYSVGERIGQLVVIPYPKIEVQEVSELSDTERGEGGYGSTGS